MTALADFKRLRVRLSAAESEARTLRQENKELKQIVRDKVRPEDRVWFDGNKLMFTHSCLTDQVTSSLETWKVTDEGTVSPSVLCELCGAHFLVNLDIRLTYIDRTYKPRRKTWEKQPEF